MVFDCARYCKNTDSVAVHVQEATASDTYHGGTNFQLMLTHFSRET